MATGTRTLLVIGHLWPEPTVSAAGSRMMQLLKSFQDAGYAIYFGSPAEPSSHSEDFNSLGIQSFSIPLNREKASEIIREMQPDVVLFDRFMTEEQFGWRVQEEAPEALRILNTEDLHSLRAARRMALEAGEMCDAAFWLQQEITLRELSSILRSDLSLVISKAECEWLNQSGIVSQNIVFYLPFMLDSLSAYGTTNNELFQDRSDFSFTGYGRHAPNADAACYLIQSIWPQIHKEIPEANLFVYGKDYPADILSLNDPKHGIFIKGWVEDLGKVLEKTRVNLAPLRFGAGLKGKIVHALEQGTPTVTSQIGAEGLFPLEGFEALIADDPDEFAAKAVQLYRREALWQQSVQSGQTRLVKELDGELHHQRLHQRIDVLLSDLQMHRARHVLGRILKHQSHQSTRYMAKWIEAKNRS